MKDLLHLIQHNSWQICLLGLIGSILVGIIKTPIYRAINKKLTAMEADQAKHERFENIYDSLVYLGAFIVAAALAVSYLFITKQFTWENAIYKTIPVWLVQSTVYSIWKKLGLKRLLCLIGRSIKKLFLKIFDRNKDGNLTFDEAVLSIKDYMTNGKLDIDKVLSKAEEVAPGFVEGLVKDVQSEAGDAAKVDQDAMTGKLKDSAQTLAKEAVTEVKAHLPIGESKSETVTTSNGNNISIIQL